MASVASVVYRYDRSALRNWTAEIGEDKLKLLPPQPSRQHDAVLRLQIEYLEKVVPTEVVLSVPSSSELLAIEDAQGQPGQAGGGGRRYFVIVDKHPLRKKVLRTEAELRRRRAMLFPASVQWVSVSMGVQDGGQPGQLEGRYDGLPEVVDLLELARWSALRSEMRRHAGQLIADVGHLALTDEQPLAVSRSVWNDVETPTLAILDSLASKGWARGQPPDMHTRQSERRFSVKDPVRERAYLQCIDGVDELVGAEAPGELRSDQRAAYYRALVVTGQLAGVPLDASDKTYRSIIKSQPGQLQQLEDEADGVQLGRQHGGSSRLCWPHSARKANDASSAEGLEANSAC